MSTEINAVTFAFEKAVPAVERLSAAGSDREHAMAILSQAIHGRALDDIQVLHLLAIGYRAAAWGAAEERARLIAAVRGPAADLLLQHQRDGIKPCPCGQVGLGRSHTAHLADVIASFLEGIPQP